jgi:hypothetical protein
MKSALRHRMALLCLLFFSLMVVPLTTKKNVSADATSQIMKQSYIEIDNFASWQARPQAGVFVLRQEQASVVCKEATPLETQALIVQDADRQLHFLSDDQTPSAQQQKGLTIIWRGTSQLENYPQAKAALLRAAAMWTGRIENRISLIVDVDFGARRFGEAYPTGVLGITGAQQVGAVNLYAQLRQRLLTRAANQEEAASYRALPPDALLTDKGTAKNISAPTSVLRSLGLLNSTADPTNEVATLGAPPAISFNSAFAFDFDPRDGVDTDKIDFEGLVVHQLGHLLGFVSETTVTLPATSAFVTPWDMFRFGTTSKPLATPQHLSNADAEEIVFANYLQKPISDGQNDRKSSEDHSASHWQDESSGGGYFGIMESVAHFGQRLTITRNDLQALAFMGHSVASAEAEDTIVLTSGVEVTGTTDAPWQGTCLLHPVQYTIQVPSGATQVKIELVGMPNLDLFVRIYGRVLAYQSSVYANYVSASEGGEESLTITATPTSIIIPGNYYIAIGNCGDGAGSFTLKATVDSPGSAPILNTFAARLDGDVLNLTGNATDVDADIVKASVKLFNSAGSEVISLPNVPVNFGAAQNTNFSIPLNGMSLPNALSVVRANLLLTDAKGNKSATLAASFNQPDTGGAIIKSASFDAKGEVMTLKSSSFSSSTQIEINGVIVTPPLSAKLKGAKIKLAGTAAQLGLRAGANRVRLLTSGVYSNLFVLTN